MRKFRYIFLKLIAVLPCSMLAIAAQSQLKQEANANLNDNDYNKGIIENSSSN